MPEDFAKTLPCWFWHARKAADHHGIDADGKRLDWDLMRHAAGTWNRHLARAGRRGGPDQRSGVLSGGS